MVPDKTRLCYFDQWYWISSGQIMQKYLPN